MRFVSWQRFAQFLLVASNTILIEVRSAFLIWAWLWWVIRFKDTDGHSLHVLVKLLATITLVLAPLFI